MDKSAPQQKETLEFKEPGVYKILHGAAELERYPLRIELTGILSAPHDFLKNKVENYEAKQAHLLIDRDKNTLILSLNSKDDKSCDTIQGRLSIDPQLEAFAINTEKRWTVKAFVEFLRQRKFFFKEPDAQGKLIASLQKWSVNIERVIKEHNSNDGNSVSSLETKVSGVDLITKFDLDIPVYKGYAKKQFSVQIGLDPKSTHVELFLYSEDLPFLVYSERERLFGVEVEKFTKLGFDCSVVNIS